MAYKYDYSVVMELRPKIEIGAYSYPSLEMAADSLKSARNEAHNFCGAVTSREFTVMMELQRVLSMIEDWLYLKANTSYDRPLWDWEVMQ